MQMAVPRFKLKPPDAKPSAQTFHRSMFLKNQGKHFPPTWSHFLQSRPGSGLTAMNYEFPSGKWSIAQWATIIVFLNLREARFRLAQVSDG